MKHNGILVVTSLLSILLLTLHITDDIVRGISKAESSNIALLVLVLFLYGTLVLADRRSGHVIMLLVGLLGAAMPVMHMSGAHYGEIARSPGGFFFVWTLWALGGLGGLTFVLAARGMWTPGRHRAEMAATTEPTTSGALSQVPRAFAYQALRRCPQPFGRPIEPTRA